MKRLLSPTELAELLGSSKRTVSRMIKNGGLIVIPVRGSLRITWLSVIGN